MSLNNVRTFAMLKKKDNNNYIYKNMLKKVIRNYKLSRLHEREENELMILNKFVGNSLWYITERENGVRLQLANNETLAIYSHNRANFELFHTLTKDELDDCPTIEKVSVRWDYCFQVKADISNTLCEEYLATLDLTLSSGSVITIKFQFLHPRNTFLTNDIYFAYENLFGAICHNNGMDSEDFCKLIDVFGKYKHFICGKKFFRKHFSNILS